MARKVNVFGLAALLMTSCSSPSKPSGPLTTEEQAILNVGLAYREASQALRRGPASAKELQPYLKKYGDPEQHQPIQGALSISLETVQYREQLFSMTSG